MLKYNYAGTIKVNIMNILRYIDYSLYTDKERVEKQQTEDRVPEDKPAPQPAKNKESNATPGQPKPASAVNESPQAQDTFDRGADIGESGLGSDGRDMAADWGVEWVDPSSFGTGPYCGIMFE